MIFSLRAARHCLASAALLAVPALLLVPGCGGGSSSSAPTAFQRASGVELIDNTNPNNPVIFDRANLSLNIVDSSSSTKTVSGTLQVLGSAAITPTATAPIPAGLPAAGTLNLGPQPGTYILKGTATYTGSGSPFVLNVRGAFNPNFAFTLTGNFSPGQVLVLRSQLQSGTVVLPLRVLSDLVPFVASSPTPVATSSTTPGSGTTATATPSTTGTPSGTATVTSAPTGGITPAPTTPGSPVGTPASPVGTPPTLP